MITLPVYGEDGQKIEEFDIDETVFGNKICLRLMRDAVLMHEANQRQGTHATKNRALISGSNAKPWRQKGTGRARAGSRKSPIWRGGGTVFGPQPRTYKKRMNKKARKLALNSAILSRLLSNELIIIQDISMDEPKTKRIQVMLSRLNIMHKCILSISDYDKNIHKSVRNMKDVCLRPAIELNCYEVLKYRHLVLTKSALENIIEMARKNAG